MKIELFEVSMTYKGHYGDKTRKEFCRGLSQAEQTANNYLNSVSVHKLNPSIEIHKATYMSLGNLKALNRVGNICTHVCNAETNWILTPCYRKYSVWCYLMPEPWCLKPKRASFREFLGRYEAFSYGLEFLLNNQGKDRPFFELWFSDYLEENFEYIYGGDPCDIDDIVRQL